MVYAGSPELVERTGEAALMPQPSHSTVMPVAGRGAVDVLRRVDSVLRQFWTPDPQWLNRRAASAFESNCATGCAPTAESCR